MVDGVSRKTQRSATHCEPFGKMGGLISQEKAEWQITEMLQKLVKALGGNSPDILKKSAL